MQIRSPLEMNDWDIEKFLIIVWSVQFSLWGFIGLDSIGIHIPIIRQIIGFLYITFIPGFLILRIFRLHQLGYIKTLLFAIGSSISTVMIVGLLSNFIYPFIGFKKPLDVDIIIITLSAFVILLSIICYSKDREYSNPRYFDLHDILSAPVLFLLLIPFISIFGVYLVNTTKNITLLMVLFVVIGIIVILLNFDVVFQRKLYPLILFVIAVSLLFHRSLISMYLVGYDVYHEYYLSSLVLNNALWDPTIQYATNGMLSIVILAPIYSLVSNMDLIWVFKVIYPLIFAFLPLGLFILFKKWFDDKIAFLSCFFFMSFFTFFTEMTALSRQEIAELFIVLLILVITDESLSKKMKTYLMVMFGFSIIVSHYGTSYIYSVILLSAWFILIIINFLTTRKSLGIIDTIINRLNKYNIINSLKTKSNGIKIYSALSLSYIILFIVFLLVWYTYLVNSASLYSVSNLFVKISNTIVEDFANPVVVEGLSVIQTPTTTFVDYINKIINYLNQIFIVVGVVFVLLTLKKTKIDKTMITFSIINLTMLIACVTIPFFSSALDTARTYHLSLLVLSLFGVLGGCVLLGVLGNKIFKLNKLNIKVIIKILAIYFVIFFLFQTQFIDQFIEGKSGSISLNPDLKYLKFVDQDINAAKWLMDLRTNNIIISDQYSIILMHGYGLEKDSRIDLNYYNTFTYVNYYYKSILINKVSNQEYIYSNGKDDIYYVN